MIDVGADFLNRDPAAVTLKQADVHPAVARHTAPFVFINMRALVTDHFIVRLGENIDPDLVGHCSGRAKHGRLHSQEFGTFFFQFIDRRVIAKHVVAYFSVEHGIEHARGGFGDSVAAEIDG